MTSKASLPPVVVFATITVFGSRKSAKKVGAEKDIERVMAVTVGGADRDKGVRRGRRRYKIYGARRCDFKAIHTFNRSLHDSSRLRG